MQQYTKYAHVIGFSRFQDFRDRFQDFKQDFRISDKISAQVYKISGQLQPDLLSRHSKKVLENFCTSANQVVSKQAIFVILFKTQNRGPSN